MYSYGPLHMAEQKQGDQLEPTYSSSVRIWSAAVKTCQMRWTIGRSGERGSGISALMGQQDDDEGNQSRQSKTEFKLIKLFKNWPCSKFCSWEGFGKYTHCMFMIGTTTPSQSEPGNNRNERWDISHHQKLQN